MSAAYEGEFWEQFCDGLKALGDEVLQADAPIDDFHRAGGFRYLTRLLRDGLMRQVEFTDPAYPVLYDVNPVWGAIGSSSNTEYYVSSIGGRLEYRLIGRRGTVYHKDISTKAAGSTTALAPSGFIDTAAPQTDAERTRLIVSYAGPSMPNSFSTLGHDRGSMIARIINGKLPEAPTARLVKFGQSD